MCAQFKDHHLHGIFGGNRAHHKRYTRSSSVCHLRQTRQSRQHACAECSECAVRNPLPCVHCSNWIRVGSAKPHITNLHNRAGVFHPSGTTGNCGNRQFCCDSTQRSDKFAPRSAAFSVCTACTGVCWCVCVKRQHLLVHVSAFVGWN